MTWQTIQVHHGHSPVACARFILNNGNCLSTDRDGPHPDDQVLRTPNYRATNVFFKNTRLKFRLASRWNSPEGCVVSTERQDSRQDRNEHYLMCWVSILPLPDAHPACSRRHIMSQLVPRILLDRGNPRCNCSLGPPFGTTWPCRS